jgi:hypothetical protein
MTTYIHYREDDGEIFGWEQGVVEPSSQPGLLRAVLDVIVTPVPRRQYFCPYLGIVDKSEDAVAAGEAPTLEEVRIRIAHELAATDQFMFQDRQMSEERRNAWIIYRQALRALKKLPTPAAQLAAWPASPAIEVIE